jgi:hypothetical protein
MQRMLLAETAILVHLKTIGIILLVLHRVVVSLLALCAGERYSNAHLAAPPYFLNPLRKADGFLCVPCPCSGTFASLCGFSRPVASKISAKKRTYIGVIIIARVKCAVNKIMKKNATFLPGFML